MEYSEHLSRDVRPSSANLVHDPFIGSLQQPAFMYHGITPAGLSRGTRIDGKISPIRRFFCLFVTFDLLLTSLLWLIALVLAGDFNWIIAYHQQILHYSLRTSLFDVVMSAICRFVILILFYALLEISHWCVVALTTSATLVFLIFKVYIFDWGDSTTQVLQVVLILCTFLLVWAEAWLMDIKVIPQERVAREYINALCRADERSPLLLPFLGQTDPENVSASVNFYSPYENSSDSSDDSRSQSSRRVKKIGSTPENDDKYKFKGKETLELAWKILNSDKWLEEKRTSDGDLIQSKKLESGHKIYRLTGSLNIQIMDLKYILYDKLEEFPKWNLSLKESKVLQGIDDCTDISYQVSRQVGIVSSREYITLRHFGMNYGYHIIASTSIVWPRLSSSKKLVRGENGPCCWAFKAIGLKQCEVRWLLNTKINGWVPQKAVDSALVKVMEGTMSSLRHHILESYEPLKYDLQRVKVDK